MQRQPYDPSAPYAQPRGSSIIVVVPESLTQRLAQFIMEAFGLAAILPWTDHAEPLLKGVLYTSNTLVTNTPLRCLMLSEALKEAHSMLQAQNPSLSSSHARFDQIIVETLATIRKLSEEKGGEYAGDSDRLANFRRNGQALSLPMESIWAVYAAKHWDALMQYINDLNTSKTRPRSEPITGRIDDLIVYLLLAKLMYEERHGRT